MSGSRHTPLFDEHVAAGARMVEFAGWSMPVQYTSILREHEAVRTAAGLFDVSHMGEIEISGTAAGEACARLFTNDPRNLEVGRALYSLLVNEDGAILDDVIIYRSGSEKFLVCVNAANVERDFDSLTALAPAGARLIDRSSEIALLALQGPHARTILAAVSEGVGDLRRFRSRRAIVCGVDALVAATGYTGEEGFELFVDSDDAVQVWRTLLRTGAGKQGLLPVGLGARDTLRVEAALPLYGHELDEKVSPWEAGVGWAVKLNRPEMVGYRALSDAHARALKRTTIGLEIEGGIARNGYPVVCGDEQVGVVTSGTHSPTLGRAVALALVDSSAIDARLGVKIRRRICPATAVPLPFYRRAGSDAGRV